MTSRRIEAFSDAVIAIVMTIMVLDLRRPSGSSWTALRHEMPSLLMYALSFLVLAIYWNNHHHLLSTIERVNGRILWANMNLLFWLSLIPFMTDWTGGSRFASLPVASYGVVLLLSAISYYILVRAILAEHGADSVIARAIGDDFKGKISVVAYAVAMPLAFAMRWVSIGLYVAMALMWLVPDRRIERAVTASQLDD